MALNSKVKHLLSARVSDAQSINDIMPLLKSIPFEEIQEAILQVIAVLDTNTANDINNIMTRGLYIPRLTRNHLDSEEIAKGYKGPLNDLRDVVDAVKSGDKLLFHDGKYAETNSAEFCFLDTAGEYQVIGIGNNVFIEFCNMNESFLVSRHLSFKNVTLEMGDGFQIDFNGSLSMEDCEIVLGSSHIEIIHGSFHAKNCVFS
eukprot:536402_1